MRSTLKRLLALALALTLVLVLSACGGDDNGDGGGGDEGGGDGAAQVQEGGEATINYPSFPDYLDPAMSYTVAGWQALVPTYTTLVTYARKPGAAGAQLIPGLAEALPNISEDGKTYTFQLRDGLQYSDGSPVKASDFEHAIKRVIRLESGAAFFYTSTIVGAEDYLKADSEDADIPGISADDETGEITIELVEPNGQFPYILAMPFAALVPSDTPFEVQTENPPPGVGPFVISEVRGSRGFTLEKNENWPEIPGLPAAHLDRITVNVVESNDRGIRDVLQNEADWMDDPGAGDALREFRETAPDRYREEVTNSTYFFFLNHRLEPFDDPQVRLAAHMAIDKTALARLFGGQLTPGCNFLPPGMQGYQEITDCPAGDPTKPPSEEQIEKARQMVRDAGAEGARVTVWGNDEEQTQAVTEYFADALSNIGLNARPRIVDGEVYFQTIGNQKTGAHAGFTNWFQDFPHPGNFLFLVDPASIQETNNQNFSNVEDPEIRSELERLNKLELSEAAEGYAALDRRIVEETHVVPYGHRKLPLMFSERIAADQVLFHPVLQTDFTTFALKR